MITFTKKIKFNFQNILKQKSTLVLFVLLSTGFASINSKADIISMCAPPQNCSASGGAITGIDSPIGFTWGGIIENLNDSQFPTELVASNGGYFYVVTGGQQVNVLGTVNTPISQAVSYSINNNPVPFTIAESITVPTSVSNAAANLGRTSILFHRDFQSPFSNIGVNVQINLLPAPPGTPGTSNPPPPTGGNPQGLIGSNLELQNVALRFDDDSISRIIQRNDALQAEAELTYANGGMLVGVWEIATPASTQGEPVFLPLENIRLYLNPSRNKLLLSPELPSDQTGLYLLRFRLLQPQQQNLNAIQIQYFVREKLAVLEQDIRTMRVLAPNKNAWLATETEFRWQAIPGARAYRVEIFNSTAPPLTWAERYATARRTQSLNSLQDDERAVTGVLVPGNQTTATISPVSFGYLNRRNEYLWRVVAIDSNGFVIGETRPRSIFTR